MSKGSISVEGLGKLQANLSLAVIKARAAAEAAVRQEVDAIRTDAVESAPHATGELEAGIVARPMGTDGEVRTTARHSTFVEHGTYKDPAQPFMAPAAEKSRVRWPARAGALIKTALEGIRA